MNAKGAQTKAIKHIKSAENFLFSHHNQNIISRIIPELTMEDSRVIRFRSRYKLVVYCDLVNCYDTSCDFTCNIGKLNNFFLMQRN